MTSTKKALKTLPAAASEINTDRNDWLVEVNQSTCNHSVFDTFRFENFSDGWQYARCKCRICAHEWDAWSAPGVQTISRKSWLALINGAPLPDSEGSNYE